MHAFASTEIVRYVNESNALPDYPSSVNSGILGDPAHYNANSYHIPIHHLPNPGGYTNRDPDDRTPLAENSHVSADDMSMSKADMVKQWNRYLAVFNNQNDPRRKYIAEYIGWNGVGSAERLDFQRNTRTNASSDHTWHAHRANRRRYWNSQQGFLARLSIDRGETIAQYEGDEEVAELGGSQAGDLQAAWLQNGPAYAKSIASLTEMTDPVSDTVNSTPRPNHFVVAFKKMVTDQALLAADVAEIKARPPVVVDLGDVDLVGVFKQVLLDPEVRTILAEAARAGAEAAEDS